MTTHPGNSFPIGPTLARVPMTTVALLLIPLVAMQFTREVNWSPGGFLVMGALLFSVGTVFVLLARKLDRRYRPLVALACLGALHWVWAKLAVGVFTDWEADGSEPEFFSRHYVFYLCFMTA